MTKDLSSHLLIDRPMLVTMIINLSTLLFCFSHIVINIKKKIECFFNNQKYTFLYLLIDDLVIRVIKIRVNKKIQLLKLKRNLLCTRFN